MEEKVIKSKVGLLKLAQKLGSVSKVCKVYGYSRDTLKEISCSKPCMKNRVDEEIERRVIEFALDKPAYGQVRVSNELKKRRNKPLGRRSQVNLVV